MAAGSQQQPAPETLKVLYEVIAPFNKTGAVLAPATRFAEDLNFDSLVVMEFVAEVEDRFDISVPLNILPDIATIGDFATALEKSGDDVKAAYARRDAWNKYVQSPRFQRRRDRFWAWRAKPSRPLMYVALALVCGVLFSQFVAPVLQRAAEASARPVAAYDPYE